MSYNFTLEDGKSYCFPVGGKYCGQDIMVAIPEGGAKINAITALLLPATVTDGQIVILTSTTAPTYYFSYSAPESPTAGDIWVHIVDSSEGYNLPVGSIILKPGATMQYIGGVWEYRDAYIGVSGEWKMFSTLSPLSSLSWTQISAISRSGEDMSKFFAVGDQKDIMIDGVTYPVQIIGMHHDDLADGTGKAGLTFDMVGCLLTAQQMHSAATRDWSITELRAFLSEIILPSLPSDLQDAIRGVVKISYNGSALATTIDKLWLPSAVELGFSGSYIAAGQGTVYPRFTANADRIKQVGTSAVRWWTRSPYTVYSGSAQFFIVETTGANILVGNSSTNNGYYNGAGSAVRTHYVCFGFCV